MKTSLLAALLFIGTSLLAPPSGAVTLVGAQETVRSNVIQAASHKPKKPSKKQNYSSGNGFIPGYVPTPYGRGDCIGWWEPLGNGLFRCRGQFIRYRY
jgi:hypothetical protein